MYHWTLVWSLLSLHVSWTAGSAHREYRFCCDAIKLIQPGDFRPKECLPVPACRETEFRKKEILRLYGCSDPTQLPPYIQFPAAKVSTDRTEGWYPFANPGDTLESYTRFARKWEWDEKMDSVEKRPIIESVKGHWKESFSVDTDSLYDGTPIGRIFEFKNHTPYFIPKFLTIYDEPCRFYHYTNSEDSYQNQPASQVYTSMDITFYTECYYVIQFSTASEPYKLQVPYFDEKREYNAQGKLDNPSSTSYFDPVMTTDSGKGYFAFPYFLVIRLVCQDESYYGEEFYNKMASALHPDVILKYSPVTTRASFGNPLKITMGSMLINLEQDPEKLLVPDPDPEFDSRLRDRRFYSLKEPEKKICYMNLCQPAYAVPQPFLGMPVLRIEIEDGSTVEDYERRIYVSPFHSRTIISGMGDISVGKKFHIPDERLHRSTTSVHPRFFFPKVRRTDVDMELKQENLHICVASEAQKLNYEIDVPASFYLKGREHLLDLIVEQMQDLKQALPLTDDDFYEPIYTFGTAPVVAIGGFYQPNLVLLSDPDLNDIHLIEWDFNPQTDPDVKIFEENGICLTEKPWIKDPNGNPTDPPVVRKPIYSLRQQDHLRRYRPGRRTYFPQNYASNSTRAIFGIISLEDRLLLKTTGGIVPIYGNSNATKGVDKVLKAPEKEKIPKCFKFIRSLNMALSDYDPILGVTYDYSFNYKDNRSSPLSKHSQEIWYGKYTHVGQAIEWTELGSKEYQASFSDPIHINPAITHLGTNNEIPEVAKICRRVYTKHILPLFPSEQNRTAYRWTTHDDKHKCLVLDGSPSPRSPNAIQLLVEMTFTYYKKLECNPDSKDYKGECEPLVMPKCLRYYYCKDMIARGKKSSPISTGPPKQNNNVCKFIPEVDCPPVQCIPTRPWDCPSYMCNCPPCQYKTDCPPHPCHPKCDVCKKNTYPIIRCDCPKLYCDIDGVICEGGIDEGLAPTCTNDTLEFECTPCPIPECLEFNNDTVCEPSETLFCPTPVLDVRKPPYCPKCMQRFQASLEGDYEHPVKEKVYEGAFETLGSDYDLCESMLDEEGDIEHYCKFSVQEIRLFVIAQHYVGEPVVAGKSWEIVSIFPQRPCSNPHFERILNLRTLDSAYFGDERVPEEERKTCYEFFVNGFYTDLRLSRFTYTRKINNHLFIYGSKLLHSLDGGHTLVQMRDFPRLPKHFNPLDYDMVNLVHQNEIRVMAFSSGALYAFLTNKRELWLGTVGSIHQALIRPNYGWSMMGLRLYKNRLGVHEATPFSLLFDFFDNLIELVAVRDPEGHIDSVIKRSIDFQLMLRNNYLVKDIQNHVNKQLLIAYRTNANEDFHNGTIIAPIKPTETLYIHYNIKDLSLYCPFSQLKVFQNYTKRHRRLQRFVFNPPKQHILLGLDQKPASLMAYSVATFGIVYESVLKKGSDKIYSKVKTDPIEKWELAKTEEAFIGYIRYLKKDPRKSGIVADPREVAQRKIVSATHDSSANIFIPFYWLNYNQIVRIEITFYIKNGQLLTKTDFLVQKLSKIQINVDNGNGDIVNIYTERVVIAKSAGVKFIIHMSLFQNEKLVPSYPGAGLIPVPITFHLIGAFGRCFKLKHWGMVGESLTTTVLAGCPPATGILFDWNSTLYSLNFRSPNLKYGDESYCGDGEIVCFSHKELMVLHFDILELATQRFVPFHGKIKLQVIGGGKSKDKIRLYNPEQIDAYNIPGKSDISLIWTIAPENNETDLQKDAETQESVLTAGVTKIKWTCNTLSPCARITPRWDLQTNFYFKIRITNNGVDKRTLCIHEREFIIMLYGFTPSPETLLFLAFLGCLFLLALMYVFFICCRRHQRVWRANKLRMLGWWKIVVATLPKPAKHKKDPAEMNRKKDSIILSLQGHLNVPEVIHKGPRQQEAGENISVGSSQDIGSGDSLESEGSETSLPRVRPRKKGATWTDMVYEQIISQRLLAIVNRNRRMREHVLLSPEAVFDQSDMNSVAEEDSARSLPLRVEQNRTEGKKYV